MKNMLRAIGFITVILLAPWHRLWPAIIILTSDQQLNDLQDPDKIIDLSTGFEKQSGSLRQVCQEAEKQGDRTLIIAFDEFFRQYRAQAGTERKLTPDMDEYISKIKKIADFAKRYKMGIGLSLLSPLELGPAFINSTGEAGRWVHYAVAMRDPETGRFCAQLNRQLYWTNNKGKFALKLKKVRAFAFKEKTIAAGRYSVVKPEEIQEIYKGIEFTEWLPPADRANADLSKVIHPVDTRLRRVQISHQGDGQLKGYDRVFVFLEYESPEMDYFSPKALPFLKELMKKYADNKIDLVSLYSDEMHIQQDWFYFNHHDNGQFCLRYMTASMAETYAQLYGAEFRDMDKYLIYFVYGPKIFSNDATAILNTQYVMGETVEDIGRTLLFRDRYYKLLNNHVVDLFLSAKEYAERLFKRELPTHAHSSWAQSPTIDLWYTGNLNRNAYLYEYTSNFIWSNTVHQAAAACYDYWKWGEFLQPTGNDFCEGGWSDRDYYGAAMAASIGIINKYPNAYAAFWGMPKKAQERKHAVNSAFGGSATETIQALTNNVHRDVDVLILYPMNLVAAEERFGSWMTQYAYANYITAEKLLELAQVTEDGRIKMAGRTFSTLVALYEILPPEGLLEMMTQLATAGGHVLWCGPPPMMTQRGQSCLGQWQNLFSINYAPTVHAGEIAVGKQVVFTNDWQTLPGQVILCDFLVDRIYPVQKRADAVEVARVDDRSVGVHKKLGKGTATFCGFRPRDDQSASLGYETRTLFNLLNAVGAYPATGAFGAYNDNTEYVSRTSEYLTTRFPNGATVIAAHYRNHRENWPGGFSRNDVEDEKILQDNPLPSDTLNLQQFRVNGHRITFNGRLICAFNLDGRGQLISFEGHNCREVEIDGRHCKFADKPMKSVVWAPAFSAPPLPQKAIMQIRCLSEGQLTIPWPYEKRPGKMYLKKGGAEAIPIPMTFTDKTLHLKITSELADIWLYVTKN